MVTTRKPKAPRRSSLARRPKIGDCTCGYVLPDLLIGATTPPTIVMICPECGQQWELECTKASRANEAAFLGIKKGGS